MPAYQISPSPEVPVSVTFAGKKIDCDRIDMYERLDRELTSFVYGHTNTLITIKRANRYYPVIMPILKRNGVPDDVFYLSAIESYFNIRAYSPAKAAGLWQFIPSTAKQYGLEVNDEIDERYNVEKSTEAACRYLKNGYAKYGDWATVMASYNAGMNRISKELEHQMADSSFDLYLNEETSRYVFRILAMKVVMEHPFKYGFHLTAEQLYQPIECKEVEVSGPVDDWSKWAKSYGITYAQLREVNPWIRAKSLTNKLKKTYKVKIPYSDELYRSKRKFKAYNQQWVSKK
ncbi:MAG: lytic transglycosylase domain-containing protein [Muribaculaceae bacterium]|nr:lytic transglycosylase domain-containing protein [Muribaculaceae bacterium]MDY3933825.1 lytic transglycosylase domain-containing protein [Muribaculaceae bacterium]